VRQLLSNLLNRFFPASDENDEQVHLVVALIALGLLAYLVAIKHFFGTRAI